MQEQTRPKYLAGAQRSGPGACGDIEPSYRFYEVHGQVLITDFGGCKEMADTGPFSPDVATIPYRGKLSPGQIESIVRSLDFREVSGLVSDWTREEKKVHKAPKKEDLTLIARKTGEAEEDFIEIYRAKHAFFFRQGREPGSFRGYTGSLGDWEEKSLREVIDKLDCKQLSMLMDDIGDEGKKRIDLPVLRKEGSTFLARSDGAGSSHVFYKIGGQIMIISRPGEPRLFKEHTTAYRYNGNLSPEDLARIVQRLGFKELRFLIRDWREPPQTWETSISEPREKILYTKKEENGKSIEFYKGDRWRDRIYFWEKPEPDRVQVYEGHLFDWHWKEFDDVVEKLSIEDLSLLLNDIKIDLDRRSGTKIIK